MTVVVKKSRVDICVPTRDVVQSETKNLRLARQTVMCAERPTRCVEAVVLVYNKFDQKTRRCSMHGVMGGTRDMHTTVRLRSR